MNNVDRLALVANATGGLSEAMQVLADARALAGVVAWMQLPAEFVSKGEQQAVDRLVGCDLVELLPKGSDGRSAPHYAFTVKGRSLLKELLK